MREHLSTLLRVLGSRPDPDELHDPDPDLVRALAPAVRAVQRWFRAEVHGLARIPPGEAVLVGNHNGGITFLEPLVLGLDHHEATGGREPMVALGHDAVVDMPLLGPVLVSLGVARASHDNADRALAEGRKVVVFPGGNYEAFRPWSERFRVDFGGHAGFVRLALRNRVPIVPFACVGGHESFVVLRRGERLSRLVGAHRWLRSRSFPVFLGLPWGVGVGPVFHLPLPAKVVIEVLEPIHLDHVDDDALDDRAALLAISRQVEGRIQESMDRWSSRRRWPVLG